MSTTHDGSGGLARRLLMFAALVVVAGLVLPAAAWLIQAISERAENWIFVLQFVIVLVVAAAYRLYRAPSDQRGRALLGAVGVSAAAVLLADAIWLFGMAG